MKLDIGSILFQLEDEVNFRCWRVGPTGDDRIELLRKFYRGEDLGDYFAVAINPRRELEKDDVDWWTAGPRVTGDRCESLERTPNGVRCVKLVGHTGGHSLWPGEAWRSD